MIALYFDIFLRFYLFTFGYVAILINLLPLETSKLYSLNREKASSFRKFNYLACIKACYEGHLGFAPA